MNLQRNSLGLGHNPALVVVDMINGFTDEQPRQGLEDWQVVDLDPEQFFGAQLQLLEQAVPPEG